MRKVAARLTDAIYFIFFLPHTTKSNSTVENPNSLVISSYTACCSLIGLTFFMVYSLIIRDG